MKVNLQQWMAILVLVVLGWSGIAISAEPFANDKAKDSSWKKVTPKEAPGLFPKHFSELDSETPAPPLPSEVDPEPSSIRHVAPPALQPASRNRNLRATASIEEAVEPATFNRALDDYASSPPPISESCGCQNVNDDCCGCCFDPLWCHRSGVFADLLYLRPGNIDYVYAVEQTGPLPTDSPTGPTGRVGFDAAVGYRLGVTHALSECSSLQASYAWFQDGTQNTINANPGNVLIFQPGDPTIPNVGATSIQASANYNTRFQQVDLDYRSLLYGTDDSAVNYFAGLRYANLKQNFRAREDVGVPIGLANVDTEIGVDGFGIGFGLDGIRRSAASGLLVYGRASASFVSGEVKANYRQTTQFDPGAIVGNNLTDFRVLSILQTELGAGWQSQCGNIRITAGYQFAGWFNSLTTGSYILGVQNREFHDLHETITFDGLVTRVLVQF